MSTLESASARDSARIASLKRGEVLPPVLLPAAKTRAVPKPPRRGLRWLWAALAAGVAAAVLWTLLAPRPRPPQVPPPPQVSTNVLHEMGSIEALCEVPVLTRFAGNITWMIEEGTFVEKGDPVVRFDSEATTEDIESREKDLLVKKDAVRRAKENILYVEARYKALVRQAEIDLELAELERKRVFDAPLPEDKRDAELTLKSAELELRQYQHEMKGYDELADKGYVSEAVRKKKKVELATRQINHVKAKSLHDLLLRGSTPEEKRVAEMAVADATKKLQIARFNSKADLEVHRADLQIAEIDLANWERELKKKKLELARATVCAPVRGRVAFINVWKGPGKVNSPVQVGETRDSGSDLAVICDTTGFRVRIWVNEGDVARVRAGQRATVKMAAFPGRAFDAVVSELGAVAKDKNAAISSLAQRSNGEAFVNVVEAKLDFLNLSEEDRAQFRINFTAEVFLHLDTDAKQPESATAAASGVLPAAAGTVSEVAR